MTNNYTTLYWITRLDGLSNITLAMACLGAVIVPAYTIISIITSDDPSSDTGKWKWIRNFSFWALLIPGTIGHLFIPNKNEAMLIIAGGATLTYIQKDTSLAKLGPQTTAIISQYLDTKLKDLESVGEKIKD